MKKVKAICPVCGKEMRLDDVDYNFPGNQDNYWICDDCKVNALEKIRYSRSISIKFSDSEGKELPKK